MSTFMQHPMNAGMVDLHREPYDPSVYSTRYIILAKSGATTTPEMVERVRTDLERYCRSVDSPEQLEKDLAGIERTWPEMRERFTDNVGLTKLMLDFACQSRYFYSYLYYTGRKLFPVALEMKDGYAIPVSFEEKFEKIPEDDWSYIAATQEPSHVARRTTDGSVQDGLLKNARSIFEAGCGLLPAYRYYNYAPAVPDQRIVACDSDERVKKYAEIAFGGKLPDNITYICGDAREVMGRPEHAKCFDIVRMTGFLSYFPDINEKKEVIRLAQDMLANEDKVIITDLQTMGGDPARSSLVRSALTNLWPMDPKDPHKLTPAANTQAAIDEMSEICRALGLNFVSRVDFCNGNPKCRVQAAAAPKCVMFLIGKHVSADMFDAIPELVA